MDLKNLRGGILGQIGGQGQGGGNGGGNMPPMPPAQQGGMGLNAIHPNILHAIMGGMQGGGGGYQQMQGGLRPPMGGMQSQQQDPRNGPLAPPPQPRLMASGLGALGPANGSMGMQQPPKPQQPMMNKPW